MTASLPFTIPSAALRQRLAEFAPLRLSEHATPLERLERLGQQLGMPRLFLKRDDLQAIGMGGNKLRKLAYLLGDPQAAAADTLVTVGALQSNHARLTAAMAARLGVGCELLLVDRVPRTQEPYQTGANRALNTMFGAKTTVVGPGEDIAAVIERHCAALTARGRSPFVIPFGGSTWRGSLGYAEMVCELVAQMPDPKAPVTLVCACGSGGMLAGIVAGVSALGLDWRIVGVSVLAPKNDITPVVNRIARETLDALRVPEGTPLAVWELHDDWLGDGYGLPTPAMRVALQRLASTEGIVMDPVYTGKAVAGLLGLIEDRQLIGRQETVVFVHSGGLPGVFAYPDVFAAEPDELRLEFQPLGA